VTRDIFFGAGSAIVAAVAVSTALLGAGSAAAAPSAADVVGHKYSDAADAISQGGGSAIVATRVGDKVGQDDCLVTNAQAAPFLRDGGSYAKDSGEVMLSLNCNAGVASATKPGNSAGSPMGRKTLADRAQTDAQAAEQAQLEGVSTPNQ
jgi:hypothetical protein